MILKEIKEDIKKGLNFFDVYKLVLGTLFIILIDKLDLVYEEDKIILLKLLIELLKEEK